MKKIISMMLVLAMLFSYAIPVSATENTEYTFSVSMTGAPATVEVGETVTLTVFADDTLENVDNFSYYLTYDTDVFDFVSGAPGEAYSAATVDNAPAEKLVVINGMDAVKSDPIKVSEGTIATVTFQAKAAAENVEFGLECECMMMRIETESGNEYPNVNVSLPDAVKVTIVEAAPVDPHADAISSSLTENKTVSEDGSTVTLKYTGLTPEDGYAPFTITVPEGVDAAVAQLKNSKGSVGALNAKNLEDGARVVKYNVTNGSTAAYQLDWDGDGTFDLTVNLDVTGFHAEHVWGEATCVSGPVCTVSGCGEAQEGGEPDADAHNYSEETGICTNDGCDAVKPGFNDVVIYSSETGFKAKYTISSTVITEVTLKNAKDKVIAVNDSDKDEAGGVIYPYIFLDGDKVNLNDVFEYGVKTVGEDAVTIEGTTVTLNRTEKGPYVTIKYPDNETASIQGYLYLVTSLTLADVSMNNGGEKELILSTNLSASAMRKMKPIVEWTSDKTDVATVEGGKVTAVAPGTATITAKVGNKTATCTVTVECVHDWSNKDGVCAKTDCGYECTHEWKDATCVAPKTCTICFLTNGEPDADAHSFNEETGKCTNEGCDADMPGFNDVVIYSSETGFKAKYTDSSTVITEVTLKNAKDKVIAVNDSDKDEAQGVIYPYIFLDGDKVNLNDVFEYGVKTVGEDAVTIEGTTVTLNRAEKSPYVTIKYPDNETASIQGYLYLVTSLTLADVSMNNGGEKELILSTNLSASAMRKMKPIVEWSSSNPDVATVSGGKVTAVAPGTATITATVGTKSASCTVTVECVHEYINGVCDCGETNPAYVAISKITLSSNTETVEVNVGTQETPEMVQALPLTVGGSEKLIATLNAGANQGITWTTSDPNVATVEDGVVTAKGVGTAYITATAGGRDVMTTFAMLAAEGEEEPVSATFPVTVSAAPASGYTVTMGEDQKVVANTAITVPVTLGHANGTTKYNAFDITLSYPAGLTLTSTEIKGLDVTTGEGTVRVKGYGEAKDAGTAPFSLTFEATAIGTYAVEVTAAKIDSSNGSIEGNAPDAGIIDGITYITVAGYDVQLPEGFTGDSTTAPGQAYSFTIPEDNYNYDVTITVNDAVLAEDGYTVNGNTYSIPAEKITGAIVVTAVPSAKTFDVTIPAEHFPGAANKATYGKDYTATLKVKVNTTYKTEITIGGEAYTGYNMNDDTYVLTIPGKDISGDIVIKVTATEGGEGGGTNMRTITFSGETGVVEKQVDQIIDGGTYTFSLKADAMEAGYTYTVKYNNEALTPENGVYSIGPVKTNITVTIEKTLSAETTVEVSDYVNKSTGMVKLVKVNGTLAEGKVFAYNGNKMFWVEQYEAWAYLDVASGTDAFTADTAKAKLTTVDGTKEAQTITAGYDVNKSGEVDINDAQLAYDIYKADMYTDVTGENAAVSVEKFLKADVNNDMKVETTDAAAVVAQIK